MIGSKGPSVIRLRIVPRRLYLRILLPYGPGDGVMVNDAAQSAIGTAGGIPAPVVLRNGYCTNRKGHCGREGRGDTLLNLTPKEASRICMDQWPSDVLSWAVDPAAGT